MRKKDQGLRDEFIQFVTQRQQEFYRLAFRYTHDQDGAMDVVQEALEKADELLGYSGGTITAIPDGVSVAVTAQ